MILLPLLCVFAGAWLGFYFQVYVLIPATPLALMVVVGVGFASNVGLWWLAGLRYPVLVLGPAAGTIALGPPFLALAPLMAFALVAQLASGLTRIARPHWRRFARASSIAIDSLSLVTLFVQACLAGQPLPVRQAAWYAKSAPTFSDTLAFVRQQLWPVTVFSTSPSSDDVVEIPRALFYRLTDTLPFAA